MPSPLQVCVLAISTHTIDLMMNTHYSGLDFMYKACFSRPYTHAPISWTDLGQATRKPLLPITDRKGITISRNGTDQNRPDQKGPENLERKRTMVFSVSEFEHSYAILTRLLKIL